MVPRVNQIFSHCPLSEGAAHGATGSGGPLGGTTEPRRTLRRALALIAFIAVGTVIATQSATSKNGGGPAQTASLPPGAPGSANMDAALPPTITVTRHARRGDTLHRILIKSGANESEAADAIAALRKVYNPRTLAIGDAVKVTFDRLSGQKTGQLISVKVDPGSDYVVHAARTGEDSFAAAKHRKALVTTLVRVAGTIDSSLYGAAADTGLAPETIRQLVHLFSWDVDFQRDIQPGDTFDVAYERVTDKGGAFVRAGDVVYAELTLGGVRYTVYRFKPAHGRPGYYDGAGKSVKKALLRTPLNAIHITSGFGLRRDPILGFTRKHKGVDFGAPIGTPIYAAGNGVVEVRRWEHGYGRYIRIRHDKIHETAYAHLSRYAKGLHRGEHVHQGQVIGYVGESGRATGPHLHYEVLVRGRQVNPMTVKFASGTALAGRELRRFEAARHVIDRRVAALKPATMTVGER